MGIRSCCGQVMTELIWALLLVLSFAVYMIRLHEIQKTTSKTWQWELQNHSTNLHRATPLSSGVWHEP